MFDKLFHFLYNTIIITIIKKPQTISVFIESFHRKKTIQSLEKEFVLNDSFKPILLQNYLKDFLNESPYCYITLLDTAVEQGAIPTCKKHEMENFHNLLTSKYICIEDKWACYTSKPAIKEQIDLLGNDIGVDFVFSPFLILKNFFQDKISGSIALYVLLQENSVTITVFENSTLLFGEYIDLNTLVTEELLLDHFHEETTEEENIDINTIDLDDIDIEDDFGDIESLDDEIADLDTLDEINDLESEANLEQQLEDNLEELDQQENDSNTNNEEKEEKLTMDFQFFSIIQKTLGYFYHSDKYKSDFVENIYVADNAGVTREFKQYIENEMFLNVYIRTIEIELELITLTKKELEVL